jgi:type I restriction enzyme S subunit
MIDGLRAYPEMKSTSLPWLGAVPAHWEVRRNGRLFGARRETGFPDLPILEVSIRSGVRVRSFASGARKQEMSDRSKYQRAVTGDIAYNMMRMWQGAVGVAPSDGLVSPAYVVARPFASIHGPYYAYLFRIAAYMRETDTFSRGIVPDRNRLYWESFKQMPSAYPPLDEQRLIVKFLDWHGLQTTKLIRAKQKLIALLSEQEQGAIDRAVTRGLNPNAKLIPSGIPWLGDMPQGWTVMRLRHLIKGPLTYGANAAAEFVNRDWPRYIRITDFRSNGSLRPDTFRSLPPDVASNYLVDPGDILFARSGATVGKAFIVTQETGNACHAGYLIRARPLPSLILPEYLYEFTQSRAFFSWKELSLNTATIENIGADKYANLVLPVPPLGVQRSILESIRTVQAPLRKAILCIEDEIPLLQEYRRRLIADVVTGKLDVRAAAADVLEISALELTVEPADIDGLYEPVEEPESAEAAA